MAGKVVNSSVVLLSKFGASRQEIAVKTATSHIRKPLTILLQSIIPSKKHHIVKDIIALAVCSLFSASSKTTEIGEEKNIKKTIKTLEQM